MSSEKEECRVKKKRTIAFGTLVFHSSLDPQHSLFSLDTLFSLLVYDQSPIDMASTFFYSGN